MTLIQLLERLLTSKEGLSLQQAEFQQIAIMA
jgi:hypothetical protein